MLVEAVARPAIAADLGVLRSLLHAYLHEMRAKGSEIRPTLRSVEFYAGLANEYITGSQRGAVVVADGDGFSMAGEATLPLDTDFGETAIGWGTYVTPEQRGRGLSGVLRRELRRQLRGLGFHTVLGGVHLGDDAALNSVRMTGWRPYQLHGYEDLRLSED